MFQPAFPYLFDLDISGNVDTFPEKRTNWNADIHLISTYGFLSEEENRVLALKPQSYLIKEVYEWNQLNVFGTQRINLDSMGLVSNWMFYFQRTDAIDRNQWSNYSNWPYNFRPKGLINANPTGDFQTENPLPILTPCCVSGPPDTIPPGPFLPSTNYPALQYDEFFPFNFFTNQPIGFPNNSWIPNFNNWGPGTNPGFRYGGSGIKITGDFNDENQKEILESMAILLDGKYRENVQRRGIYNKIEKYVRTFGFASDTGLNCYNFALHSGGGGQSPFDIQPSGAINLSRFNSVQFEIQTYNPPLDPSAQTLVICDPQTNEVIGINKPVWNIYKYTYNFKCFEERFNLLRFESGNAALAYAR